MILDLIGAGIGLAGSLLGGGSSDQEKAARQQMQIAGTAFSPINVGVPGGGGVTFGNQVLGQQVNPFAALFGGSPLAQLLGAQGGFATSGQGLTPQQQFGGFVGGTGGGQAFPTGDFLGLGNLLNQFVSGANNVGGVSPVQGGGGTQVPGGIATAPNPTLQPLQGGGPPLIRGEDIQGQGFRRVGRTGIQTDLGAVQTSLGDLGPLRDLISGFGSSVGANNLLTSAGGLGAQAAAQGQQLGGLGLAQQLQSFGGLDALQGLTGGVLGGAFQNINQLQQNPFQAGLQAQLFGDAGNLLGQAGQGFDQAFTDTLGLLRDQARPFEDRAFSDLNQNLFDTGRIGTSGGALQTEAFARGLGQADTQRQLQALGEARAQQNQALNVGTGLLSQGGNLRELQDSLLGSAISRFGNLGQFSQNLSNNRFDRGSTLFGQAPQATQLALSPFTTGLGLQNASLDQLSGIQGLLAAFQNQALQPTTTALNFMSNQANARTGAGSQVANLSNVPSGTNTANFLSSLGGALGGDLLGGLQGLFGGGGGGGQSGTQNSVINFLDPNAIDIFG